MLPCARQPTIPALSSAPTSPIRFSPGGLFRYRGAEKDRGNLIPRSIGRASRMGPQDITSKAKPSPQPLDLILSNRADCIYVVDHSYNFAILHSTPQFYQTHTADQRPRYESKIGRKAHFDFCFLLNVTRWTFAEPDYFGHGEYEMRMCHLIHADRPPLYLHFL